VFVWYFIDLPALHHPYRNLVVVRARPFSRKSIFFSQLPRDYLLNSSFPSSAYYLPLREAFSPSFLIRCTVLTVATLGLTVPAFPSATLVSFPDFDRPPKRRQVHHGFVWGGGGGLPDSAATLHLYDGACLLDMFFPFLFFPQSSSPCNSSSANLLSSPLVFQGWAAADLFPL